MPATDPFAILSQRAVRHLLWLLPLGLALPALKVLLVPPLRGRAGEAQVGAVLDRIGADTLHEVLLPDGRGGIIQIDHLILTGAGILVVETKNYSGLVFGQERETHLWETGGFALHRSQAPVRGPVAGEGHERLSAWLPALIRRQG
jgi:restriction system protein